MFYRQKILLALIEAFGGKLNKLELQKYLFLYTQKCQTEKSYDFVPYRFGCFSFQSYADRRNLTIAGHLKSGDDWALETDTSFLDDLKNGDKQKLMTFSKYYADKSGDNLVKEVYRDYPYYAINSEIAERLLSKDELDVVKAEKTESQEFCFFTIGYEGASFEDYLNRLIQNNVKLLCDVRKNPLSRKYGFSKKTLSETLEKLGIKYMHMPELGIISDKRKELKTREDYYQLFDEYEKTTLKQNKEAIENLFSIFLENKRIAITCFEETECMCHRGRIAKALAKLPQWSHPIKHI